MNNEQKRYTVEQISKYKSEAKVFDKMAEKNKWFIYGCILIIISASHIENMENVPDIVNLVAGFAKDFGMTIGLENFRRLIGNMSKKSSLENTVETLEYQIQFEALGDNSENSYKGRAI